MNKFTTDIILKNKSRFVKKKPAHSWLFNNLNNFYKLNHYGLQNLYERHCTISTKIYYKLLRNIENIYYKLLRNIGNIYYKDITN